MTKKLSICSYYSGVALSNIMKFFIFTPLSFHQLQKLINLLPQNNITYELKTEY